MKSRYRFFCFTLTFVLVLCTAAQVSGSTGTDEKKAVSSIVQMIPAAVDMKETDGPGNLYALSAVLMDGDSGRVLYEKEGYTARPNASTTKVMTCILALEKGSGDDYVMVSENAASQPEVQLNLKEGEQYYLEDLLYSLMLKIHQQFILSDIPVISSQTFLSTLITVFQLNFNRISAYRTFNPHCSLCFKTNIKQSSISTAGTMHFQKCFLYFCFSLK